MSISFQCGTFPRTLTHVSMGKAVVKFVVVEQSAESGCMILSPKPTMNRSHVSYPSSQRRPFHHIPPSPSPSPPLLPSSPLVNISYCHFSTMSGFQRLSGDLVLHVADHLGDKDFSHLALGSHFLHRFLSRTLFTRAMEEQTIAAQIHALTWAIRYGHTNLVRTIVRQPDFSASEHRIEGALSEAAALGHCEIISIPVSASSKVSSPKAGSLPLYLSAMNGRATAVKCLLDLGAQINASDNNRRTAFALAIRSPREIFRKLQKGVPKHLSHRDEA